MQWFHGGVELTIKSELNFKPLANTRNNKSAIVGKWQWLIASEKKRTAGSNLKDGVRYMARTVM